MFECLRKFALIWNGVDPSCTPIAQSMAQSCCMQAALQSEPHHMVIRGGRETSLAAVSNMGWWLDGRDMDSRCELFLTRLRTYAVCRPDTDMLSNANEEKRRIGSISTREVCTLPKSIIHYESSGVRECTGRINDTMVYAHTRSPADQPQLMFSAVPAFMTRVLMSCMAVLRVFPAELDTPSLTFALVDVASRERITLSRSTLREIYACSPRDLRRITDLVPTRKTVQLRRYRSSALPASQRRGLDRSPERHGLLPPGEQYASAQIGDRTSAEAMGWSYETCPRLSGPGDTSLTGQEQSVVLGCKRFRVSSSSVIEGVQRRSSSPRS
ncbi:hypothetical protein BD414DRAFT_511106 [Trametes punicea]|nr:hypothetical protein BD414DRAFT_511106 [Trametes punicea]